MSFALSEEQVSLQESVKDFFETKATSEVVRKAMEQSKGIDKSIYESVCNDLGLASLIIEEQYEGFGASDLELNLAIYEHGYYLAPTPLRVLSYITMLLQECGSDDSKNHILPKISTGVQYGAIVTDQSTLKVKIDKDKISGDIERILFLEDAENLIFVLDELHYLIHLFEYLLVLTIFQLFYHYKHKHLQSLLKLVPKHFFLFQDLKFDTMANT